MILTLVNLSFSLATPLVLVLALGYIANRHQRLFLLLFMLLTALESTRDFAPSIGMSFLGVSVYPQDLIMVVAAGAGLNRIREWRIHGITRIALLVFSAGVGMGLISWISIYGIQLGANSWRPQLLIISLLMYTTTRRRAWSWKDLRTVFIGPAIVVGLASVAGILIHGFGSNTSAVIVNGALRSTRPASASGSLMMLVGLWISVLSVGKWNIRRFLVIGLLGSMVLLVQDRSVWVAAIVGVSVWWLAPRLRSFGAYHGLSGLGRTLIVVVIGMAVALVGLSVAALGQSASSDGTWLWRVARWKASMSVPRSRLEWIVGSAFGPTPVSNPGLFETSAHSLYVNAIETTGVIVLVAIVALIIAVGRSNVQPSSEPIGLVLSLTFLSYGVAYQLPEWAWAAAGILLASTRIKQPLVALATRDRKTWRLTGPASPRELQDDQTRP